MKRLNQNKKRGFTIVEVAIVVAIMGILSSAVILSVSVITQNTNEARAKNNADLATKIIKMEKIYEYDAWDELDNYFKAYGQDLSSFSTLAEDTYFIYQESLGYVATMTLSYNPSIANFLCDGYVLKGENNTFYFGKEVYELYLTVESES